MKKLFLVSICFFVLTTVYPKKQQGNLIATGIIDRYLTAHNYFATEADVWGNYTIDLNVEAIINYTLQTETTNYIPLIDNFFNLRNFSFNIPVTFSETPFCDVYFSYFLLKRDSIFIKHYINQSYAIKNDIPRTSEGAICIQHKGEPKMLIDFLQNYMIRMARAGWLSGDTAFYNEMMFQFEKYSERLQYPDSKLFSQGRGWMEDKTQISPSAWLRGQAWLMRGLVTSLQYVPKNSKYSAFLIEKVTAFANTLVLKQDKSGMWHNLPLLAHNGSYPEVSGSAMIAYYMLLAHDKGYLSDKKFRKAALKTKKTIRKYINPDFSIRNISPGPGTLFAVDEYKTNAETDNPHGTQALILLLSMPPNHSPLTPFSPEVEINKGGILRGSLIQPKRLNFHNHRSTTCGNKTA